MSQIDHEESKDDENDFKRFSPSAMKQPMTVRGNFMLSKQKVFGNIDDDIKLKPERLLLRQATVKESSLNSMPKTVLIDLSSNIAVYLFPMRLVLSNCHSSKWFQVYCLFSELWPLCFF